MKKKNLIVDGLHIEFLESDSVAKEKTIVFLHGWMQDCTSFKSILDKLEKDSISFVSISLPGFGLSQIPKNDRTIFDYSDFITSFIEKAKVKKPIIVGHSFGGRIAIILGSKYKNIGKIVLIGAAGIKQKVNKVNKVIVKIGKIVFSLPGLKFIGAKIKSKIGSRDYNSAGNMKNIFLNTINTDLTYLLNKINVPSLLIWGKNDTETRIEEAKIMHSLIKESQLEVFDDGTHFVFQEYPEDVYNLIKKFYKKNDI